MSLVVYDLEFTVHRKQQYLSEIIEIGAVKIEEQNNELQIVDMFQSFARPQKYRNVSDMTLELTGILQDDINRAPMLPEVLRNFVSWLGQDYYLISWGPDDKLQLIRQCNAYSLSLDWIKNYNDVQEQFSRLLIKDKFQRIGLSRALEHYNIPFEGRQHRAINDAFNTAKLIMHQYPNLIFKENDISEEMTYSSELVYQTDKDEGNFPFGDLKDLLDKLG